MLHERVINHVKYHENDVSNSITATYNLNYNKLNDLLIITVSQKRFKERLNFISLFFVDLSYSLMHSVNEFSSLIRNRTSQLEKLNNMKIATEKIKNIIN